MSLLHRLFGKHDSHTDFARLMPALAEAGHNISLGIYWRLSKRYEMENREVDPHKLAYAVVYDLTQDEEGTGSLGDFAKQHRELIANEVREAAGDEEIRHALSLEYAGRLMAISWNSGRPLSEEYGKKSHIIVQNCAKGIDSWIRNREHCVTMGS